MTGRPWLRVVMLACAGGAILGWSIDSFVRWKQPARSVQVLTLDQLVGFIVSATLLVIAGWTLVVTLRRRGRPRPAARQPSPRRYAAPHYGSQDATTRPWRRP